MRQLTQAELLKQEGAESRLDKAIVLAALRRGEKPEITPKDGGWFNAPLTISIGWQTAKFESRSEMYRWGLLCHPDPIGVADVEFWKFIGWDDLADDLERFRPVDNEGFVPIYWTWKGKVLCVTGWSALGQFIVLDAHADGAKGVRIRGEADDESELLNQCRWAEMRAHEKAARMIKFERVAAIVRRLGWFPTTDSPDVVEGHAMVGDTEFTLTSRAFGYKPNYDEYDPYEIIPPSGLYHLQTVEVDGEEIMSYGYVTREDQIVWTGHEQVSASDDFIEKLEAVMWFNRYNIPLK